MAGIRASISARLMPAVPTRSGRSIRRPSASCPSTRVITMVASGGGEKAYWDSGPNGHTSSLIRSEPFSSRPIPSTATTTRRMSPPRVTGRTGCSTGGIRQHSNPLRKDEGGDQPRDYDEWHRHYDDPDSSLSWRLRRVQQQLNTALDHTRARAESSAPGRGWPRRDRSAARPARCRPGVGGSGRAARRDRAAGPGRGGRGRSGDVEVRTTRRRPERRVRGGRSGADRAAGRHLRQHLRRRPVAAARLRAPAVCARGDAPLVPRARRVGSQQPDPDPAGRGRVRRARLRDERGRGRRGARRGALQRPAGRRFGPDCRCSRSCAEGGQEPVAEGVHRARPAPAAQAASPASRPTTRPGRGPPGRRR